MANQKITYEQALQVRELAKAEVTTQVDIGRAFDISPSHVCNIKYERRWPTQSVSKRGAM